MLKVIYGKRRELNEEPERAAAYDSPDIQRQNKVQKDEFCDNFAETRHFWRVYAGKTEVSLGGFLGKGIGCDLKDCFKILKAAFSPEGRPPFGRFAKVAASSATFIAPLFKPLLPPLFALFALGHYLALERQVFRHPAIELAIAFRRPFAPIAMFPTGGFANWRFLSFHLIIIHDTAHHITAESERQAENEITVRNKSYIGYLVS